MAGEEIEEELINKKPNNEKMSSFHNSLKDNIGDLGNLSEIKKNKFNESYISNDDNSIKEMLDNLNNKSNLSNLSEIKKNKFNESYISNDDNSIKEMLDNLNNKSNLSNLSEIKKNKFNESFISNDDNSIKEMLDNSNNKSNLSNLSEIKKNKFNESYISNDDNSIEQMLDNSNNKFMHIVSPNASDKKVNKVKILNKTNEIYFFPDDNEDIEPKLSSFIEKTDSILKNEVRPNANIYMEYMHDTRDEEMMKKFRIAQNLAEGGDTILKDGSYNILAYRVQNQIIGRNNQLNWLYGRNLPEDYNSFDYRDRENSNDLLDNNELIWEQIKARKAINRSIELKKVKPNTNMTILNSSLLKELNQSDKIIKKDSEEDSEEEEKKSEEEEKKQEP